MNNSSQAFHVSLERMRSKRGVQTAGDHKITLQLKPVGPRGVMEPVLTLDPPRPPSMMKGALHPMSKLRLFTATTKMRAPSFSLPAGPPSVGGSCPASVTKASDPRAGEFICHGCYATTGNYGYDLVQITQRLRLQWVKSMLEQGLLAEAMSWGLYQHTASRRTAKIVIAVDGAARTTAVELNLAYFRIHDSGDFFSPEYLQAWLEVVKRFPKIRFWAPTRMWIKPGVQKIIRAGVPKNLAIRPSALYVGDPAPAVEGFSAGTAVSFTPPPKTYDCPAYRHDEHSCESARCRTCWTRTGVAVNYSPHGGIETPPRKNPAVTLEQAFRAFAGRSAPRANPNRGDASLGAFLASHGTPPSTFGVEQWMHFLNTHGITDPGDQEDVLEGLGEWG